MNIFCYGKSILRQELRYVRVQAKNKRQDISKSAILFLGGVDNLSGCSVSAYEAILADIMAGTPEAKVLLRNHDLYFFPSVNPDCELLCNSFTNASGSNLRTAQQFTKVLQPELFYLHKALLTIRSSQTISLIVDLCGNLET